MGHALLATSISEDSTATKIQVYDCNYPTDNVVLYLYKNDGKYTSWKIRNHSRSNDYISEYTYKIAYTLNGTLAYYLAKELEKPNAVNETIDCDDEYALLSSTASDFEIANNEGESVEIKDSELTNENSSEICIPIIPMDGESDSTKSGLYWVDRECTISCDASSVDPITTELAGNTVMISATVTSTSDLHMTVDKSGCGGSAAIESEKPTDTSVTVSQTIDDEVVSVTASATSGNIVAISETDKITFQGIENGQVDINFQGKEKTVLVSDDTIENVSVSLELNANAYDFTVTGKNKCEEQTDKILSKFSVESGEVFYRVTFDYNEPTGNDNLSTQSVKSGNTVYCPSAPSLAGYVFTGWSLDAAGEEIYTFDTSINESFTLYAQWKKIEASGSNPSVDTPSNSETNGNIPSNSGTDEEIPSISFTDVPSGAWYEKAVISVAEQGLMCGYSNGKFGPIDAVTRAQFAQILYNMNTDLSVSMDNNFVDVKETSWYYTAVNWAATSGIVNGMGNGKFEPNEEITREQLVVMLYNFAQAIGADTNKRTSLSTFPDSDKVSGWANNAMQWAVAEGLLNGSKTSTGLELNPRGTATRAEVATVLVHFVEYLK